MGKHDLRFKLNEGLRERICADCSIAVGCGPYQTSDHGAFMPSAGLRTRFLKVGRNCQNPDLYQYCKHYDVEKLMV